MPRVSCVSFNQDGSRLALGFDADDETGSSGGFCVFSCEPVSLESCSPLPASPSTLKTSTSVTSAALLYKTRVSAFVFASQPNTVALYDGGAGGGTGTSQTSSSLLGELSFPASTRVLAVRLRRDAVAVALSDGRAAAYSLDSLRLLRSVETGPNEIGLLALAAGGSRTVFACPSGEGGTARGGTVRVEFADAGRSVLVRAARHGAAALALSQSAELLATASERGTLVRVFALGDESGSGAANASEAALTPCLRELRRGGGPARMLSLAFSPSVAPSSPSASSSSSTAAAAAAKAPRWLAAASDKGTVHVWSLSRPPPAPPTAAATRSRLLLAAAAAAAGAPSPSSLAAERSSFHFKLQQYEGEGGEGGGGGGGGGEGGGGPMLASLSFSPGGEAVFAAASAEREGGGRCSLVAVAVPGEDNGGEATPSSSAAAELFCVPDLFALLPR